MLRLLVQWHLMAPIESLCKRIFNFVFATSYRIPRYRLIYTREMTYQISHLSSLLFRNAEKIYLISVSGKQRRKSTENCYDYNDIIRNSQYSVTCVPLNKGKWCSES